MIPSFAVSGMTTGIFAEVIAVVDTTTGGAKGKHARDSSHFHDAEKKAAD
jgi:hypothetical protein